MAEDVDVSTFQAQVVENRLAPPHIATPAPLVGLELNGGDYRFDPTDSTAVLQGQAPTYTASYQTPTPGAQLPAHVGSDPADPTAFSPDLLAVDPASADAIAALSFLTHFESISKGVLDLRDILFFVIFILAWLLATAIIIELKKAN